MAAVDAPARLDYRVVSQRIVAALIDGAIVVVVFVAMALLVGDKRTTTDTGPDGTVTTRSAYLSGAPLAVYLILVVAYFTTLEAVAGRTLGKMITGLRVVRANGQPLTWSAALIRNLLRPVDFLPFLYIIGMIAIAATRRRQRLGDLVAKTLVVRR